MDAERLAVQLVQAETENDVISLLKAEHYWDNYDHWHPFGDNENNFSTIGNQQNKPDAALVEKLINSVDAMLMKECMKKGIEPSSASAPNSMYEALKQFYGIKDGLIQNLDLSKRNDMSQNIVVAATGTQKTMNIVIADKGEGQTPTSMPHTILSINKSNKLKVPFVQGKFNMGGTGVLPFCGKNSFQLVISKRCPEIADPSDSTFDYWSVTLVRRESPRESRKSSMYTYLTDKNGDLLKFKAQSLKIIPLPSSEKLLYEDMEYGTYIKLFNYSIPGYKSNILFDFNYRLSMLMPNLAHPIRLRECRDYRGHSLETTLSGLITRLNDDRQNNLEPEFPDSNKFNIEDQPFSLTTYVFKEVEKDGKMVPTSKNYREDDGVLFIVNGQTHGIISDSFFNRANLSYLSKSLLIIVDCSNIDIISRENMFMNSRDRLRDGGLTKSVETRIKEILKDHVGLKRIQNERRASAIYNKIGEDRPLQDVLQRIITKSPVLSKLLTPGQRLQNPFNLTDQAGIGTIFHGKKHPTFFKIKGSKKEELILYRPINHGFRVQFETDAENNYFNRSIEAGELLISMNGVLCSNYIRHLGLFNGTANLVIDMPKNAKQGDKYTFKVWIKDDYIVQSFENTFILFPTKPEQYSNGQGSNNRTPPISENANNKGRLQPERLAMPNIYEIHNDEFASYNMDEKSALTVKLVNEGPDFFVNMDNVYLLSELKGNRDISKDALTKARYKYSLALIGMGLLGYYLNNKEATETQLINVEEETMRITSILSPIIIPMLDSMSDLDDETIAG